MKPNAFGRIIKTYPDVRRLWLGETISALGSNLFSIALMWYVFVRTGSGLATGLVAVANFVPQVALGAWFGVLADRYHRQRIMVWGNVASAVWAGALALAVALRMTDVWPVYVATVLMGVAATLYNPARAAIFPDIVQQEDLLTTHALFHSSRQVARIVGASVGGVAVAVWGAAPSMSLDLITFLAAAVFVARMRSPRSLSKHLSPPRPSKRTQSARVAWHWMKQRPVLLVMGIIGMVSNIALGPSNVLPPMLIRQTFHASAAALGLFDAAIGMGIVAGGIIIGMLTINRMGLTMVCALAMEMVGLLGVSLSPNTLVADVGNFVLGVGLATANAPGETMMQTIVPQELLGRVTSLTMMMSSFAIPITFGGVGLVGDALGPHMTFALAAGLMAATVVAALMVPGIRAFRLDDHRVAPRKFEPNELSASD